MGELMAMSIVQHEFIRNNCGEVTFEGVGPINLTIFICFDSPTKRKIVINGNTKPSYLS
jgi:hypothetical protein